jgi:hypothetical protein
MGPPFFLSSPELSLMVLLYMVMKNVKRDQRPIQVFSLDFYDLLSYP